MRRCLRTTSSPLKNWSRVCKTRKCHPSQASIGSMAGIQGKHMQLCWEEMLLKRDDLLWCWSRVIIAHGGCGDTAEM